MISTSRSSRDCAANDEHREHDEQRDDVADCALSTPRAPTTFRAAIASTTPLANSLGQIVATSVPMSSEVA
jgi:hypothetical protein